MSHQFKGFSYEQACERARELSLRDECTKYVNAILSKRNDSEPFISHYVTSDWYDGSTVATFCEGERIEAVR